MGQGKCRVKFGVIWIRVTFNRDQCSEAAAAGTQRQWRYWSWELIVQLGLLHTESIKQSLFAAAQFLQVTFKVSERKLQPASPHGKKTPFPNRQVYNGHCTNSKQHWSTYQFTLSVTDIWSDQHDFKIKREVAVVGALNSKQTASLNYPVSRHFIAFNIMTGNMGKQLGCHWGGEPQGSLSRIEPTHCGYVH